jgi:NADPH:quinone reductase-like Zn-dependent oxidoreductase
MPERVIFRKHGEVDVLELDTFVSRAPAAHQIRVRVAYAGVNYADVIARRGFYKWAPPLPTCVGFEISGVVVECGSDVVTHRVGDRVLAVVRFGGYSTEVTIDADRAWTVPEGKSLAQAAALPAVTLTAWHALCEVARVRKGESVLIQAVAGGVGLAALQIARELGLCTYGTASSEEKLAFARQHGLEHGIDYVRQDFEQEIARLTNGRGVDCVLDSLGGAGLRKGYRSLARSGRVVTIGAAQVAPDSRSPVQLLKAARELLRGGLFHPFDLIEHNRSIAGVQILLLWDDLPHVQRGMAQLLAWWQRDVLSPHLHDVLPLAEAWRAHEALQTRKSRGKLVLACAGEVQP